MSLMLKMRDPNAVCTLFRIDQCFTMLESNFPLTRIADIMGNIMKWM